MVWTSSNIDIAKVNGGIVTPVADGSCVITAQSGDFSAVCTANVDLIKYNVTTNLQHCTLSNTETVVLIGNSYTATITPTMGYSLKNGSITVTMDGVDISETVTNGIIIIPEVTGDIVINISCVAVPVYNIHRTLVGCTSSNDFVQIGEGNPLVETFTVLEGYKSEGAEISITMGNVDITNLLVGNVLTINEVYGDITIIVKYPEIMYFSITRTLTNCTSNSTTEVIEEGSAYSEIIIPDSGYALVNDSVSIMMGDVNITSTAYNNGIITIDNVTDNINIVVSAQADNSLIVDIDTTQIVDGKLLNLGYGGDAYDMTLNTVLSNDSFSTNNNCVTLIKHANGVVNYGLNGSSEWTLTVDVKADDIGDQTYGRLFRTDVDAPSCYYSKSGKAFGIKLAGQKNAGGAVINNGLVTWSPSGVNSCYTKFSDNLTRHVYTFTCDKQTITLYIDGAKTAVQNASALTASTYVGIGDTDSSKSYYANQISVYKFQIWNKALSDSEIASKDTL